MKEDNSTISTTDGLENESRKERKKREKKEKEKLKSTEKGVKLFSVLSLKITWG